MSTIVSVIFPLLTVVIGGACILLLSVTTTLRASNGDLTARVEFLEKERDRIEKEAVAAQARFDAMIAAGTAELEALGKVVTGEAHLVAIIGLITDHHNDASTHWDAITKLVRHMDGTQATLVKKLEDLVDALGEKP